MLSRPWEERHSVNTCLTAASATWRIALLRIFGRAAWHTELLQDIHVQFCKAWQVSARQSLPSCSLRGRIASETEAFRCWATGSCTHEAISKAAEAAVDQKVTNRPIDVGQQDLHAHENDDMALDSEDLEFDAGSNHWQRVQTTPPSLSLDSGRIKQSELLQ